MLYFLYILFFLSCILLVGSVLLQPGKTDAGALFTSNVSSQAVTPRGTASVLANFTIVAAIVFMLSALMISQPVFSGGSSVLSGNPDTEAATTTESTTAPAANTAAPVGQTIANTSEQQTIVIPNDTNSASAPASAPPSAPAAPSNAAPPASNAPANK